MKSINYLYDLIDKSDVTVIGYSFKNERLKDELISRLSCYYVGEISYPFNVKSILRDAKINQVLGDNDPFKFLLIDINDVIVDVPSNNSMNRSRILSKIVEDIRQDMMSFFNEDNDMGLDFDDVDSHSQIKKETPYKLIITTTVNKAVNSEKIIDSFSGGHHVLYAADLAFYISDVDYVRSMFIDPHIKIIKNRYDHDNIDIDITTLIKSNKERKKLNII